MQRFGYAPPDGLGEGWLQPHLRHADGNEFVDSKGYITVYLSYRHADSVLSSQRDFGACQLDPIGDANGNNTAIACGGFANSNWFQPTTGANTGNVYSVYQHGFELNGSVATNTSASFNSQPIFR